MLQHFVINPNTGRRVRVGGAMYKKLIKQGMLETSENDENVVGEYNSDDDSEYTQDMIDEYNKELPANQHCVRGRGAYKNKLVKRSKMPSYEDVVEHTAKISKKALKKCNKITTNEEETELERLITEELLKLQPYQSSRTKAKKPLKGKTSKFAVKQESEESDSDEDDTE